MNYKVDNENLKVTPAFPIYWWVILVGLLVWSILAVWPRQQAAVEIPYSTLLEQVITGNVSQVTITGSEISGTLIQPMQNRTGNSANSGKNVQEYSTFKTQFPEVVNDPNLVGLLNRRNVQINAKPSDTALAIFLQDGGLPLVLLATLITWMGINAWRAQQRNARLAHAMQKYTAEQPKVTFEDVAGEGEAKSALQEMVDFLRSPEKLDQAGARAPRGILLVGQPGTGKSLLAEAAAGEAGAAFFNLKAADFAKMGGDQVSALVQQAMASAPAIILIDGLEAGSRPEGEQAMEQLWREMDAIVQPKLVILAATNRPDLINPALLGAGRFERQISLDLPDRQRREGILCIHTRQMQLAKNVNLGVIAQTTTGFSGADLATLCSQAALIAAQKNNAQVNMADFEEAFDRILLGAAPKLLLNDQERRVAAYHEAGHALAAWLIPAAQPIRKVSIVPQGGLSKVTEPLPGDDHKIYGKEYLLARLAVMLGGRAAEEVAIGEVTTTAENDLIGATRLARRMVTRWGMGRLGPVAYAAGDEQPLQGAEITLGRGYSEETAARIDRDVQELLETSYAGVCKLLGQSRSQLDRLVDALLKNETLNHEDMARILGTRPYSMAEEHLPPATVRDLHQKTSVSSETK